VLGLVQRVPLEHETSAVDKASPLGRAAWNIAEALCWHSGDDGSSEQAALIAVKQVILTFK
jgi:hypothetical protein